MCACLYRSWPYMKIKMPAMRLITFVLLLISGSVCAQKQLDTTLDNLPKLPAKYLIDISKKATQYTSRITNKTEKTLTKLSHWENKIKRLLEKTSPEIASHLFGGNQPTFTSVLQQLKSSEATVLQYQAPYDKYQDEVMTSLKYLARQKQIADSTVLKQVKAASNKMGALTTEQQKAEAMQQFIKERKKQLMQQALKQVGSSKYLNNINKEAFYYTETLKNYQEFFTNSKKAEETGKAILNSIPAFQKFMQQNSQLSTLFGQPGGRAAGANIAGLQTRASVQALIQERVVSGGPNAEQAVQQNLQQAQNEMNKLKDKLSSSLNNGSPADMPGFKPNMQKTKTFAQRVEFGSNLQFFKSSSLMPTTTDIGLSVGYKLNDKSIIGIGASYKLGMGSIAHINLSNEGAGIRSYTDWKLKKQFYISGGFEMNYLSNPVTSYLLPVQAWQQSALLGISKKISIKSRWSKETKIQLLYDFLSQQHLPVSQPVLFRVGYVF